MMPLFWSPPHSLSPKSEKKMNLVNNLKLAWNFVYAKHLEKCISARTSQARVKGGNHVCLRLEAFRLVQFNYSTHNNDALQNLCINSRHSRIIK